MKRILSLLCILVLLSSTLCCLSVSAAKGSLSASASASTVTVGNTVTVTVTYKADVGIAAIDSRITYNAATFDYVSCNGGQANGGAGVVNISWYADGAQAPTSVTFTLSFKAKAAGDGKFAVSTEGFDNDEDYTSLGKPGTTLSVAANNPTLSANANLKSLTPSKGTLTPKFNPNTVNYTIDVNYDVTSLTLSAAAEESGAKTVVSGKNSLDVGNNTRTITVTAPNGSTKTYTVVIRRAALQTTTTTKGNSTTASTTTTTAPSPEAVEVTVDGVLMTVSEAQPDADLPVGFKWDFVSINGVDVSAAKNETTGMVLVYLTNEVEKSAAFYIYREEAGEFSLFRPLAVKGGHYVLLDMPDGQKAPVGTVAGTFAADSGAIAAFVYEDTGLSDLTIVYAMSPAGVTDLYVHDATDGSLQRYREIAVATQPEEIPSQGEPQPEPKPNAFVSFVTTYRATILTVAAACCGLAILIAALALTIRLLSGRSAKKH